MLDVNGEATYHEIHGEGPPVLLLHGGFCSIETWRSQIPALVAAGFQVHAVERPGDGRSPKPRHPLTYPWMVDHTVGYMNAVGIERGHLVGFSDGAIVGILAALGHPDRVRSVVSIAGSLNPQAVVEPEKQAVGFPEAAFERLKAQHAELSPDEPDDADTALGPLLELWQREPQIDPDALASITAPTLVMAGDHDLIRLGHTALISRRIPGARLAIVPDASHMLMLERPEIVNLLITTFLREVA